MIDSRLQSISLPPVLQSLSQSVIDLALDLRWTWSHAGDALWQRIDGEIWDKTSNPRLVLQNLTRERLEELNGDEQFKADLEQLVVAHETYCARDGWFGETQADAELNTIAYFCMEYGLGEALPLYAGGLGMLAGDHLKAASDLGVPLVAVGLLYQEGYFRQLLDANGWQQETYPFNDSTGLPVRATQDLSGAWLNVSLEFPGRLVRFRVWQAQVGRIKLYLLDSNDPLNTPADRGITAKLYAGGKEMRLMQEIALGIGGWRVLESLDVAVDVCHLNEGHAAFVTLERARSFMRHNDIDFQEALWATRAGNIFTTHTPVAAGFDIFDRTLIDKYARQYASSLGVELNELASLGCKDPAKPDDSFNMAYLAARTCGSINGVSQLHGKVSRRIFQPLYPDWPENDVPVTHITNGVHIPSWDSSWADALWTEACGKDRWRGTVDTLTESVNAMSDTNLWMCLTHEREDLIHQARSRLDRQLGQRGFDSVHTSRILDPNVLTLGFARRFTEYKRPNLLLYDQERFIRLLTNSERPVQIIIAGKAHPNDDQGKRFIQQWAHFTQRPEVRAHAVFLEDYDIRLAKELVQGTDVWINTPRRPWEACGTSGMKVLANGGLNLSELDGWWAEAYTTEVGWALGDGEEHSDEQWDGIEAEQLYSLLENEVVPLFYTRDETGIPRKWISRVRASMSRLAPQFSSNRMVRDYVEQLYIPAAADARHRTENQGNIGQELHLWYKQLEHRWHEIHWGNMLVAEEPDGWAIEVQIYLGEISPDGVQIQLYADARDDGAPVSVVMQRLSDLPGSLNGFHYECHIRTTRSHTDFTPRAVAYHPDVHSAIENNLIQWWSGQATMRPL